MKKGYKSNGYPQSQNIKGQIKDRLSQKIPINSGAENLKLIRELESHQKELELKNKELISSKEKADLVADRYVKLYDLSPTSYFTLSRDGEIIELNLIGSQILGKDRSGIIDSRFDSFISEDSKQVFSLFLEKIFKTKNKESCEVTLSTTVNSAIYVLIFGIVIENGEQCLLTVVDITERRLIAEVHEFLLQCGNPGSGEDFFESLAKYLSHILGMEYVCIDRLEGDGQIAHTVAIYNDGKFDTNISYALKETPCGSVVEKTICCFPENVCSLFPHDASLRELRAVSYVGTTLWSFDGKPIGLIAVIGRRPLKNPGLAEAVLKLVSARAGGELERKQSEKVLRDSEEKFRLLFDEMIEGFALHEVLLDERGVPTDYRFLSVNQAFERQTGLKAENIIGKKVSEILPTKEQYWIDTFKKVALTGESVNFINYSSELKRHFKVIAFSHKRGYFATIFQDITDLILIEKELESTKEYLENLINNANAPIIVWNPDTEIQLFNHAFERLTGYCAHEVEGKKLELLFPRDSLRESKEKIKNALTKNWETIEIPIQTKRNETRIVLWNSANIYKKGSKKVLSTIAQGNDITERLKAEEKVMERTRELEFANLQLHKQLTERILAQEALRNSEAKLKELNITKDKFFNIVAHDLKNPFTSMLGSSELLFANIDKMSKDSIRQLAMILNDSAKGGYAILQNLLEWSRSQTGLLEFNPQRVNINDLVFENLTNLHLPASNKDISLHFEPDGPIYLYADKNMLNTILRNLLSNSVKFNHRGGKIFVGTKTGIDEALISVKDTGIGISKDQIDKLFRIDTKFSVLGTENEQGTGLGLKLSKEFVEKHGGRIWVESAEGKGSEFIFSIPLKSAEI